MKQNAVLCWIILPLGLFSLGFVWGWHLSHYEKKGGENVVNRIVALEAAMDTAGLWPAKH